MGRVSRYKKEKKVFNVETYLFEQDEEKDFPVAEQFSLRDADSRSRKRRMIQKYGPDGEVVNQRNSGAPDRREANRSGKTKAAKRRAHDQDDADVWAQESTAHGKKRPNESLRDFNARVDQETQAKLWSIRKNSSRQTQKKKEYFKLKKEKSRARKTKGSGGKEDLSTRSRPQHQRTQATPLFVTADRPPEFSSQHIIKKCKQNPNDRDRFAKLALAGNLGVVSPSEQRSSSNAPAKSAYEQMQLEALRLKVMRQYHEIKKKKRLGNI